MTGPPLVRLSADPSHWATSPGLRLPLFLSIHRYTYTHTTTARQGSQCTYILAGSGSYQTLFTLLSSYSIGAVAMIVSIRLPAACPRANVSASPSRREKSSPNSYPYHCFALFLLLRKKQLHETVLLFQPPSLRPFFQRLMCFAVDEQIRCIAATCLDPWSRHLPGLSPLPYRIGSSLVTLCTRAEPWHSFVPAHNALPSSDTPNCGEACLAEDISLSHRSMNVHILVPRTAFSVYLGPWCRRAWSR